MNGAFLIHDSSANGIPGSENQLVVGSLHKSVDHGKLLVERQCNDLGSGRSTQGGIRRTGSRWLRNQGGGRGA